MVELAGIKDVTEAIKKIGETPLLEFKEENTAKKELTKEQQASMNKFNDAARVKATDVLGKLIKGGDFGAIAKQFSEDKDTKDKGGELGWITSDQDEALTKILSKMKPGEISKDLNKTPDGYEIYKLVEARTKKDGAVDAKEIEASHILICWKGIDSCESGLTKEEALAKIKKLKEQVDSLEKTNRILMQDKEIIVKKVSILEDKKKLGNLFILI
jgi:parvulin-like peptidyl-prolyl isomerase